MVKPQYPFNIPLSTLVGYEHCQRTNQQPYGRPFIPVLCFIARHKSGHGKPLRARFIQQLQISFDNGSQKNISGCPHTESTACKTVRHRPLGGRHPLSLDSAIVQGPCLFFPRINLISCACYRRYEWLTLQREMPGAVGSHNGW